MRGRLGLGRCWCLVVAAATVVGCFRGADVSKIVCNDSKYCPHGYTCVVPQDGRGRCEKTVDGSALDGAFASDRAPDEGSGGIDGAFPLDGASEQRLPDVAGIDQSTLANPDTGASIDMSSTVDLVEADGLADLAVDAWSGTDAGWDVPTRVNGSACQGGSECSSGYCADGVCCDGACTGQCQACAEQGHVGACITINGKPRGARAACAATNPGCAGQCSGSSPNQCSYPGGEVVCSPATCTSDFDVQGASVCNGAGACATPASTSCGSGKYCAAGACVAQVPNGGSCQSDSQCASGNCSSALCCAASQTACAGACVSLSSSNQNCGSCGRACATGSSCSGGSCYLVDGQPCSTGNQCLGGICSTFYLDGDGDGYGISASTSRCGTTAPAGYAIQAGDCCDSDPSAHPGQTATFPSADLCGDFDYNCDGNEVPKSNGPTDCGTPICQMVEGECTYMGGCTCGGDRPCTAYSIVACGAGYYVSVHWCGGEGGGCTIDGNGYVAGTQECN